jgi:hypothetical protein
VDHKIALTEYFICIDSEDTCTWIINKNNVKIKWTCVMLYFPIGTAKTIRHLKGWIHTVQLQDSEILSI